VWTGLRYGFTDAMSVALAEGITDTTATVFEQEAGSK